MNINAEKMYGGLELVASGIEHRDEHGVVL
jgi:hypothetical protein